MRDLTELSAGLNTSNTLLLKEKNNVLECQFLSGGLVCHVVFIHCKTLAAALKQESLNGIIEGSRFISFRNNFDNFSFKIKARKLFLELSAHQTTVSSNLNS